MIVEARLVKKATADGLMEFHDDVPVGRVYWVILWTRHRQRGYNFDKRVHWEREMIQADNGQWLPVECLEILTVC